MATAKKAAASSAEPKDESKSEVVTTGSTVYLPPGVAPDLKPGVPSLDPDLEKIREDEAAKLAEVVIDVAPKEASIDPELVKQRDEQIKRETERANQSAESSK